MNLYCITATMSSSLIKYNTSSGVELNHLLVHRVFVFTLLSGIWLAAKGTNPFNFSVMSSTLSTQQTFWSVMLRVALAIGFVNTYFKALEYVPLATAMIVL